RRRHRRRIVAGVVARGWLQQAEERDIDAFSETRPSTTSRGRAAPLPPAADRTEGYGQLWWQTDVTSPTQMLSQLLAQQNESAAQIWVTHGSQPLVSLAPTVQIPCSQVGGG